MEKSVQFIAIPLMLFFCIFSSKVFSQCPYPIDQQQGLSNIGVYGTDQWQSFKSGGSQKVGSIDLYSNAAYAFNGNITLKLYNGTGTGGSNFYTKTFYLDTVPSGWIVLEIPWSSAPTLTNGNTYTLRVQTSNNLYLRANTGNLYTDGYYNSNVFGTNSGWDLQFRTTWGDKVTIVHTLLGDTEYCENGPWAALWMDDTESGIDYKLYRDGVYVQTRSGTGSAKNFSSQGTVGHYTVVAQNPSTLCTYDMAGSVDITEVLRPLCNAGPDDTLCGYEYTLQGTSAENYSSIVWTSTGTGVFINNGTLTPTYVASEADLMTRHLELTFTAYPNSPCQNAVSDVMNLMVLERAEAGQDETICKGSDFLLKGGFYGDVPMHDTLCATSCDMPIYCLSSSINPWYIYIYNIQINNEMVLPTVNLPIPYFDLTDSIYTTLYRDSVFFLKIMCDNYFNIPENISVFFDWNRDGDFLDPDERYLAGDFNQTYSSYSKYITVPPGALLGQSLMRIIYSTDTQINECGTYYLGQTIDTRINVKSRVPDYPIYYNWTGPNGFTSNEQRPTLPNVSIYEAGSYQLEMTNAFGCVRHDTMDLTVLPKDTISPDTEICWGDSTMLTITGPAADMQTFTFEWSNSSTNDTIIVWPTTSTTFYCTVTGPICTTVDSVRVTVHPLPFVDLGNDTTLCRWTSIEIDSNYVSYDWCNGAMDTYWFNLDTAGSYHVVVIDTNHCTNNSDTVYLSVAETPVTFSGLAFDYLTNATAATLTGNPAGGTFTGPGISGSTFSPVNAGLGTHEIIYAYTDATPCVNRDTQYVQVFANDLNMVEVVTPVSGFLTSQELVTVRVENRGLNAVDQMLVSFQAVTSGLNPVSIDVSEAVNQTVAPGDTLTYTFSQTVDMSTEEEYFCTASLTTPGDEIVENDSLDVTITNYVGSNCMNPYKYTFTASSIPTIQHSINTTNWYEFTLDSAYINFTFTFHPNPAWSNMDVNIWESCSMANEIIPDNSSFLPASITLGFDTIWPGSYIVQVTGSGDYSLDVSGLNGVYGCTNPYSPSYNPLADFDDGNCANISYDCSLYPPGSPAVVSSDFTWNTDSVLINCDVNILDGVTVTVTPGTVILFTGNKTINVSGTILAEGAPNDSIFITGSTLFNGGRFVFDNGATGSNGAMSDNDTSRFEYCQFNENRILDNLIYVNNYSRLVFDNNNFWNNSQSSIIINNNYGLILCENSSDIRIINNLFSLNLLQVNTNNSAGLILCNNSDPLISYNILTANSIQTDTAGVITCTNLASPTIKRNKLVANITGFSFGGALMCLSNSDPTVEENLIIENLSEGGAAVISRHASGYFLKNTISHNISDIGGGFLCDNSQAELHRNIIQFNLTNGNGAGIAIYNNSDVTISNCLLQANRAFWDPAIQMSGVGGGVYANNSTARLYNNVIGFNDGFWGGGIAGANSAMFYVTNNTIGNNYSYAGGAAMLDDADATFTNTIIYHNHSQLGGQIYNYCTTCSTQINLNHCNIEGGQNGIVNNTGAVYTGAYQNSFDIAPLFIDELNYNFDLQYASACINKGTLDTTGLGIPPLDFTGQQRILNDTIDIGAFESLQVGTCGNIVQNTTWNADTVCVACDIVIKDSATLTIDPGTVVEFLGPYKLDVQGCLKAEGQPNDSIIFTAADTTGFHNRNSKSGGWMGIRFDNGPLGAFGQMDDNDSSFISYCKINYSKVISNYLEGFSYLTDELYLIHQTPIDTFPLTQLLHIDTAFDKGGAIYLNNYSKLRIANSDIAYNKAYLGGSIYCENNASPEIENTKIYNNEAISYGGGVFLTGANPKLKNTLICNNSAIDYNGDGIASYFSMPELTNVTVVNNSDSLLDNGMVFMGGAPIIKNSILWGDANSPDTSLSVVLTDTIPIISYSNIQGMSGGLGNINSLPLFVSPTAGSGSAFDASSANYSILPSSPCVNAGTPDTTGLGLPLVDLGDSTRILNGIIEMGAYEVNRILGCTNPAGLNYNPLANVDDGSCEFSGEDCGQAINYGTVNDPAITGLVIPGDDKWAYFTVTADYKSVSISLCGSNFDTEMELYEDCDSTTFTAYDDDSCIGTQSKITIDTLNQGTYYVRFFGKGTANGSYHLEITGTEILNTTLSATHVTCWGYNDGSIDMTISGGASPFTIEWSNGMNMEDPINIVAGNYMVTVTDIENSLSINSILITQPDAPTRDYNLTHVVCHGDATGEIDVTVDGDYPPFSFSWGDGPITEDRNQLLAGTYYLTITGDDGCEVYDTTTITQNDLISPSFEIEHISCYGESDGEIDQTVTGGVSPYTFEWEFSFDPNFSKTYEDLTELAYGTYYLTITDDSACQVTSQVVVYEPDVLEASIVATPVSIAGASDGIADLTVTGGMIPYSYLWSNDSITEDINAVPEGTYDVTVTDDHSCTVTASVYISEPDVNITQSIILPQDWSIFSTYINMAEPDIDSVLSDIVANVIIAKDGFGNVYYPAYGTNLIGDMTIGQGYYIKMAASDVLEVYGPSVIPENTYLTVDQGWGILGYLRHPDGPINEMLDDINAEIIIVKNGSGMIYWPQYYVNMIGNMQPGEGYKIKMASTQTFTYPSNNYSSAKFEGTIPVCQHFYGVKATENNMTLCIPAKAWKEKPKPGDEIGVISGIGQLVGSAVFTGGNTAISLWGNDAYSFETDGLLSGENFTIKLWCQADNSEEILSIEAWEIGTGSYQDNQISIVGKINRSPLVSYQSLMVYQNIPNPFSNETEIRFYLPNECDVEVGIYNVFGKLIENLPAKEYGKGLHKVIFDAKKYASGTYFYKIKTPDKVLTKSMNIIKQ